MSFTENSRLNTPSLPNKGTTGEALKQQALQTAAQKAGDAVVGKSQQAQQTIAKASQAAQTANQVAGMANSTSGNTATKSSPSGAAQQAAAQALGLVPNVVAEIIIGGKPMNHYSSFAIHEISDGHHHFTVSYAHNATSPDSTPLAGALDFIGERILINIAPDNIPGTPTHAFSGVVTSAYKSFDHNPYGDVIVEGYSPTFLLDDKRTATINSWYKGSIDAIIQELTRPLQPYRTTILAAPKNIKTVDYICQYKETPYQFLRRMAHDYGEYFFYDGMNLYYGKPAEESTIKLVYGKDCEHLRVGFNIRAVAHTHMVYHSATDKKEVKEAPGSIDGLEGFAKTAYDKSKKTFTAPSVLPAPFRASTPTLLETAVKSHAASEAADMYQVSGTSTRSELKVGSVIELYTVKMAGGLQAGTESLGKFILTRVSHRMSAGQRYSNEFEGVPASVPMLPVREDIAYPLAEAQPAVVTDNKDPDGQGRVRVKFYWASSDKGNSDWIKVLTPDAGGSEKVSKNRGLVTIPEEGDLVMVDFRYGNPDEPFVTGSMHPGTKASGGGQGNNIKSLTSKSGHTLNMNDGAGITLMDKSKLNHIVVDGKNTITITAAHNITLTNGKATISMIDGKISIRADESIDIQAPVITAGSFGGEKPTTNMDLKAQHITMDGETKIDTTAPTMSAEASTQITIHSGDTQIF